MSAGVSSQPRLLQVIQQGQLRGAELFALDLATELRRRQAWEVSLLSLTRIDAPFAAAAADAGMAVVGAGANGRLRGFEPRLLWRLRTLLAGEHYQIVQANGAATLKYLVVARRMARAPWRLIYRAIGLGSYWRRRAIQRLAYRWLLAQPDLIIAVGRTVANDLARTHQIDPRRIVVVPNGVRAERLHIRSGERDESRALLGVAPADVVLLYVGSLTPEKGVGVVLATLAACRAEGLPARAFILGEGPLLPVLKQEAERRGMVEAVRFVPPQPRLGPYLAAADLCLLPSRSEGMPAALIEAGMAGIPAVACAVGGVPEIVEDRITGRLVPADDEQAFVRAVVGLVRDGGLRGALGDAARHRYRRFEIGAVAEAYNEAYDRLLGRAG